MYAPFVAAALASLDLFEQNDVLANARANAELIGDRLGALRGNPGIVDVRQRGIMGGLRRVKFTLSHQLAIFQLARPVERAPRVFHAHPGLGEI